MTIFSSPVYIIKKHVLIHVISRFVIFLRIKMDEKKKKKDSVNDYELFRVKDSWIAQHKLIFSWTYTWRNTIPLWKFERRKGRFRKQEHL